MNRDATIRRLYKGLSVLVAGNATAKIISAGALVIIARIYSPSDFGDFSVFVSFVAILTPLVTLKFSAAIPIADESDLNGIIRLCLFVLSAVVLV